MAFELYGMLAGNVSPTTGENVKPAYGGAEESFLKLVVTPIYKIIEMVKFLHFHSHVLVSSTFNLYPLEFLHRKLNGARQ